MVPIFKETPPDEGGVRVQLATCKDRESNGLKRILSCNGSAHSVVWETLCGVEIKDEKQLCPFKDDYFVFTVFTAHVSL